MTAPVPYPSHSSRARLLENIIHFLPRIAGHDAA
jgi:hypothetical protein